MWQKLDCTSARTRSGVFSRLCSISSGLHPDSDEWPQPTSDGLQPRSNGFAQRTVLTSLRHLWTAKSRTTDLRLCSFCVNIGSPRRSHLRNHQDSYQYPTASHCGPDKPCSHRSRNKCCTGGSWCRMSRRRLSHLELVQQSNSQSPQGKERANLKTSWA